MQRYLAKSYHTEAHRTRIPALVQMYGAEVEDMLLELEAWLRTKNESVADPLLEAFEESLPLQRLNVTWRLRNTLRSTNLIGSMFSLVRHCERTITHTSSGSRSISRMTRDGMAEEPVWSEPVSAGSSLYQGNLQGKWSTRWGVRLHVLRKDPSHGPFDRSAGIPAFVGTGN